MRPYLSRDCGADILDWINGQSLGLVNQEDFAGDGLMCEYVYLIDFDKRNLEVYFGFHKGTVPKKERFSKYNGMDKGTDIANQYAPVKLKKVYSLDDLPTKKQFLKDLGDEE